MKARISFTSYTSPLLTLSDSLKYKRKQWLVMIMLSNPQFRSADDNWARCLRDHARFATRKEKIRRSHISSTFVQKYSMLPSLLLTTTHRLRLFVLNKSRFVTLLLVYNPSSLI